MNTKEKRYLCFVSNNLYFIKIIENLGIKNNYVGFYYLVEIVNLLIKRKRD